MTSSSQSWPDDLQEDSACLEEISDKKSREAFIDEAATLFAELFLRQYLENRRRNQ